MIRAQVDVYLNQPEMLRLFDFVRQTGCTSNSVGCNGVKKNIFIVFVNFCESNFVLLKKTLSTEMLRLSCFVEPLILFMVAIRKVFSPVAI